MIKILNRRKTWW